MSNNRTCYVHCNVLNIHTGDWIENCSISICDDKIAGIGSDHCLPKDKTKVVDATGLWAIPGLIDAHVHLCDEVEPALLDEFDLSEPKEQSLQRAVRNVRQALSTGITTLRDVGSADARSIWVRENLSRHLDAVPTILSAGNIITYTDGHCAAIAIEVSNKQEIYDAVKKNADAGADLIKVTNDPEDDEAQGRGSDPTLSVNQLGYLVEIADSFGLPVACHTFPSVEGVRRAMLAGCHTIEHAVPLNNDLVTELETSSSILVPTVSAAIDEFPLNDVINNFPGGELTPAHKTFFNTNVARDRHSPLRPGGAPVSVKEWLKRISTFLPVGLKNDNIAFAVGTDAGCMGTNFRSAPREIFFLNEFGASTLKALQFGTIGGAKALGLDNVGSIEVGKNADILFFDSNPLMDLTTLTRPQMVLVKGYQIPDGELNNESFN
ncbi:MAG TPA: hypothetical protein ENJ28_01370 [Gammaproteobacteria bacterium]|nr:hypothetical protein [Gammaproteobacteria bacterium]